MQTPQPPESLAQLEAFLAQDPQNEPLLAQAFDVALRVGRLERAEVHLHTAVQAGHSPLAWGFRRAHWLMAGQQWPAAKQQLEELRQAPGAPAELIAGTRHDEAYISLHERQPQHGIELLAPLACGPDVAEPTQALWLRLLHQAGRLDEALSAARDWAQAGSLTREAMAVGALVALDEGDLSTARAWADQALAQGTTSSEALVARATVALGDKDAGQAQRLLERAMARNPQDGRVLSALAFSHLLAGQWQVAALTFHKALQLAPHYVGSWQGLGWSALLQNDLREAGAAFEAALALDRNFAESQGGMAVVLARRGDIIAAEEAIRLAVRLDPQVLSARYAQAVLDGSAGDPAAMQQLAFNLLQGKRQGRRG